MKHDTSHSSLTESFIFSSEQHARYRELYSWRQNLGSPVLFDVADSIKPQLRNITIISWNAAIGKGDFAKLFLQLKKRGLFDKESDQAIIMLIQEAYRKDPFIPGRPKGKFHGGKKLRGPREDIVDIARTYGLSLRYMPSMHNGASTSDRGNAILSNVALGSTWAITLPHVQQNRIAVAAQVLGLKDIAFVSAHFDISGKDKATHSVLPRLSDGRIAQARELIKELRRNCGQQFIMGADFNTALGSKDPVIRTLEKEGLVVLRHEGHTFHSPIKLMRLKLDHIVASGLSEQLFLADAVRIDECNDDHGRFVLGSDHHPLMTTLNW
jgi:endonuclease/exonuclease/phosphatase family metal-dependent hydrolase